MGRSHTRAPVHRLVTSERGAGRRSASTIAFDHVEDLPGDGTVVVAGSRAVSGSQGRVPGSDPDVWTGSARGTGQAATGWTRPYEADADPRPGEAGGRTLPRLGLPRLGPAFLVVGAVVAVVLLVVAAVLPRLNGLGSGSGSPAATHAPAPATRQQTVTVEAESPDNSLTGSARIGTYQDASGGRLVRAIGVWGGGKGPGGLRFNNVVVAAAGTYTLTFYFVNIKGQASRTVVITTGVGDPVNVTATNGTSVCCDSQQVEVQLQQGVNSITFTNPDGEAPAIDRIIVSAP